MMMKTPWFTVGCSLFFILQECTFLSKGYQKNNLSEYYNSFGVFVDIFLKNNKFCSKRFSRRIGMIFLKICFKD